jgi:hypothetical protein
MTVTAAGSTGLHNIRLVLPENITIINLLLELMAFYTTFIGFAC